MIKKVLLHTHIEGSLTRNTLIELSQRNNVHIPFDVNTVDFGSIIDKNDWNTFRRIFYSICNCFKNETDYYTALFNYGLSLKNNNVVYAEVSFSPWRHLSRDIKFDDIYNGFEKAITELQEKHNITIRLICDFVRNPDEDIDTILDWLVCNNKNSFIVGVGNSGGIGALPRKNYQKTFYKLKEHGYKITVHSGELEHPNSVFEAINYLYADRIGHGITLTDYPNLFEKIKNKNIHFELCPTANNFIGLGKPNFRSIREMLLLTNNCSINTDDELIFQTNIENEFSLLIKNNIISDVDVVNLSINALKNSFLNTNLKKQIL
jgi:aminodeoxyfutalosine deaminase